MKEKELEDKLVKNLNKIESGLSLIERQKRVSGGVIDLFCKDKNDNYVIVEIKRKPHTNVVGQLAKYNMSLVKGGLKKRKLRTILVAQDLSKTVKMVCEYFNFEIKNVYREKIENKKDDRYGVPSTEELITFIKDKKFVNLSMIAKFFNINNITASDLANDLVERKLARIKILGANKLVVLKKK